MLPCPNAGLFRIKKSYLLNIALDLAEASVSVPQQLRREIDFHA